MVSRLDREFFSIRLARVHPSRSRRLGSALEKHLQLPDVSWIARVVLVSLAFAGWGCEQPPATPAVPSETPPAPSVTPLTAPSKTESDTSPVTRSAAETALAWLEQQVRAPAGDPTNPWALAHGLLAFGKDFATTDGRSAVTVVASFAEPRAGEPGQARRYGFAPEQNGKPVEPHAHLLVKTFLEIGLDPSFSLRAADGKTIDVRRLLTDMRASVRDPSNDHEWHDAAWWLTALELDPTSDPKSLAKLREAALVRLEADDAVISLSADNAFAPDAPMGVAKRNKTHIYGHPCGGLHFMQAVFRGAGRAESAELIARAGRQVDSLLARYRAERALYAEILRARPTVTLPVSGQQLKFFGHVLEALAVVDEVGLLRNDPTRAEAVATTRRQVAADLLRVIAQLQATGAYARLGEISAQQPQLYLDLIGDGCHAIHGLRNTLSVLPAL